MPGNDDLTEVWEDESGKERAAPAGTPSPAAGPSPATPPPAPPAGGPLGLPLGVIIAGAAVLGLLVLVLAYMLLRPHGPKTAPSQSAASAAVGISAAAASASSAAPAAVGQTAAQVAAAFGMTGVWASDCNEPASNANPRETYSAAPDGAISDVIDMGPGEPHHVYRWDAARMVGPDQIALDGSYLNEGSSMHVILEHLDGGRLHVFQAINGQGRQVVTNGAFDNGDQSPPQEQCSG